MGTRESCRTSALAISLGHGKQARPPPLLDHLDGSGRYLHTQKGGSEMMGTRESSRTGALAINLGHRQQARPPPLLGNLGRQWLVPTHSGKEQMK